MLSHWLVFQSRLLNQNYYSTMSKGGLLDWVVSAHYKLCAAMVSFCFVFLTLRTNTQRIRQYVTEPAATWVINYAA